MRKHHFKFEQSNESERERERERERGSESLVIPKMINDHLERY